MHVICPDVDSQESISAMLTHFTDRVFNNLSLSIIQSDGKVSEVSPLIL